MKKISFTGKRIPGELFIEARKIQAEYLRKHHKKISLQEVYRMMARASRGLRI